MQVIRGSRILGLVLAFSVMFAGVAVAATLDTGVNLSTNVALPTEVSVGNNSFKIFVTAEGSNGGAFAVVNKYNMDGTTGVITPSSNSADASQLALSAINYGNGSNQGCAAVPAPLGCTSNPFEVTATLVVPAGTANGTTGTLTVSHTGSSGTTADATPAQGFVTVVVASDDYCFDFLAPLTSNRVAGFKRGSTIPVKIAVTDCDGNRVTHGDLAPTIALKRIDSTPDADVSVVVSSSAADSGSTMRYDEQNDIYIFNLSTKKSQFNAGSDLLAGDYRLTISGAALDSDSVDFALNR